MQTRLHYLQHVPFEGPGYIESWVKEKQFELTSTRFYLGEQLPAQASFDWLIVMGGPMSVGDESDYPWLKAEKQFIRKAIDSGKTVLGVCLGAQLIANVLGAQVYPNTKKEIGWFPVSLTEAGKSNTVMQSLPSEMEVLHWHGDTFDLPKGALLLAQTDICKNQAFLFNERVLGLQFHFEATPETLALMVENCRHELVPDEFVHAEATILKNVGQCAATNKWLSVILNNLAPKF